MREPRPTRVYANATAVYRLGDYVYWSRTYSWGAIHKAVELRREGVPGEEVAEATGIPRSVVWTIWRRLGLSGTAGRGRRARERETGRDHGALAAEAVRLYCEERVSTVEAGRLLGVSDEFVRRAVLAANRRMRTRGEANRLRARQQGTRAETRRAR